MQDATIVGVDEAGRGALAGPVVAGACVLGRRPRGIRIDDSKQMTPEQRDEAYTWLVEHCVYGVGIVEHHVIDQKGILFATELAMQQAVAQVACDLSPLYLLVDGRDHFWFDHPHSSIIRGDSSECCIAAASILAKVTRDRWMCKVSDDHPAYGFSLHKGYGTAEHFEALAQYGLCSIHRRTFLDHRKNLVIAKEELVNV